MINLKMAYNDDSEELPIKLNSELSMNYPLVKFECYHENKLKEKKKAYRLKGSYSARMTPFSLLTDSEDKVIKAFYSEDNSCTYDNIIDTLNKYIVYNDLSRDPIKEEKTS